MSAPNARPTGAPTMPSGTEVASYRTYLEAQAAVDYLSDNQFDVSSITIVGTDLHLVERVTGRLTMGKVALSGLGSGLMWGLLMGLLFSMTVTQGGMLILAISAAGGALLGMLMSAILYAMTGGQRDFTSSSQVVASRYAVLAAKDVDQAFALLQKTPGNQMRPKPARSRRVDDGSPTEYGSRPDEKPRFGVRTDSPAASTGEGAAPAAPAQPAAPAAQAPEPAAPAQPQTRSEPAAPETPAPTSPSEESAFAPKDDDQRN